VIPFAVTLTLSPAFSEIVDLGAIHPSLKSISRKSAPEFMRHYPIKSAIQTASVLRIAKSCLRIKRAELVFDIEKSN
jgi:hypothetical protein